MPGSELSVMVALLEKHGVLLCVIVALWKGWIVLGREYTAVVADRDFFRSMFLRGIGVAERAVDLAKTTGGD